MAWHTWPHMKPDPIALGPYTCGEYTSVFLSIIRRRGLRRFVCNDGYVLVGAAANALALIPPNYTVCLILQGQHPLFPILSDTIQHHTA